MNILIIEDEIKSARALSKLITDTRPDARIVAQLQSVDSSVQYLAKEAAPDLIFMDIQLSDGKSFDIFKSVKVTSPVVFCTAFDEYTLEAFKANGVDYILKPFSREDIERAFEKVGNLQNFYRQPATPNIEEILAKITAPAATTGKTSFLVFRDNKYTTVQTEDIAYFFVKRESTMIMTFNKHEYPVNQSLDQVSLLVSPKQFYRLNRQYLISFAAVKEVEHYFARKLLVNLLIPAPEKLLVAKEKVTNFLEWLENR